MCCTIVAAVPAVSRKIMSCRNGPAYRVDARSSLAHDRIQQFLLLLYGHTANYQGRGSFISNEQQSLYQDPNNPSWRASMGEIQASFCTPSQTLVASMTAMQLLHYERLNATIWIARGAPRRWYNDAESDDSLNASSVRQLFGVQNGPTRWGNVSFRVGAQQNNVTDWPGGRDLPPPRCWRSIQGRGPSL